MTVGPDPSLVAARSAIQPDAIQQRIRRNRMGDLTVSVRDGQGRPQKNVRVRIEQTRHAFLFGCNIFALDPGSDAAWQKAYQARFTELFNYATLPFYWGAFEPQRGKPDYARLDAMASWCNAHGLTTKGHPLIWHEVWPGLAPKTAVDSIPLLRQRVADILGHYKDRIRYWDVVNEANAAPNYPQTGVGDWVRRDGPAPVVATALSWARQAAVPGATLIYNDFDTSEKSLALLEGVRIRDMLPDAIGIQSHMHSGTWPLEQLWATAERFAPFGKPIHFTETTVISGESKSFDFRTPPTSWFSTPEGEEKQADYLAQFYSILFSHPAVRAITYWDFSDRNAWLNAPAGILRSDMSPKPAYGRLKDLIRRQWWTDSTLWTDFRGQCKLRAFYGDYRITVIDASGKSISRQVSYPMGSSKRAVELRLP